MEAQKNDRKCNVHKLACQFEFSIGDQDFAGVNLDSSEDDPRSQERYIVLGCLALDSANAVKIMLNSKELLGSAYDLLIEN